jgi:hypothetical protein
MGKIRKNLALIICTCLAVALSALPISAAAAESVEVLGQVGVDQCPVGYQYSTGISVNVTTGVYTTICNAPPNDADLLLRAQDSDFQNRINQAQAAAESASRAWNQANPGLQKCIQWGPITHANGVSTSSGGVCANPVALPEGTSTPLLAAPEVGEEIPVIAPNPNLSPTNSPFFVEVPGQVGIQGCPAGYQGANGLSVNATTGVQTTQCWSAEAWTAYRLGGNVWQQYQTTGGAYDIAAELDRREKLASLIARAKSVADAAADSTPGIKRCSTWTGYGETGQVCGYTFINPQDASDSDSGSVLRDDVDLVPANAPSLEASSVVSASSFKVKPVAKTSLKIKSLTPKVCRVSGLKVSALKKGSCTYSLTSKAKNGKKSTVKKSVVFVR